MFDWDYVEEQLDIEMHLISQEEDRYWAQSHLQEIQDNQTEWSDLYPAS